MAYADFAARFAHHYAIATPFSPHAQPIPPAELDTVFPGTSGNDHFNGTSASDTFNMQDGGKDVVDGKGGNDFFNFGGSLTAADKIDGGGGYDILNLAGNYSGAHAVTFNATTILNVDQIDLTATHSYDLTLNAASVADNAILNVNGAALVGADQLFLNASALGPLAAIGVIGGSGDDTLTGGQSFDSFDLTAGGNDAAFGGAGGDTFTFGGTFDTNDHVDGGANGAPGNDLVSLTGDYALTFGSTTMTNVEVLVLHTGTYDLTIDQATIAAGASLRINASATANPVTFNASADSDGSIDFVAGSGVAHVIGSANAGGGDLFEFGANLTADDTIDGRAGNDTLSLDGDYSDGFVFGPSTIRNVENILLAAGNGYFLTLDNLNVLLGQSLAVDGGSLGASDQLKFDGSTETSSALSVTGGAGNDTLYTGSGDDTITLGAGNDTASGGSGDDTIVAGANWNGSDVLNGGSGKDTLSLAGDYSSQLLINAPMWKNIEKITVADGNTYNFQLNFGGVDSGDVLTVDGSALTGTNVLNFGASDGDGRVKLTGGAGQDSLSLGLSGQDVIKANGGDDFIPAFLLTAGDRIDGGSGFDTILWLNSQTGHLQFSDNTITNVDQVTLYGGHSYDFALADGNVAAAANLTINGFNLTATDSLHFDGSRERDGNLFINGGAGDDTLIGGRGNDMINAGDGNDVIDVSQGGNDSANGGNGTNTYFFGAAFNNSDSVVGGTSADTVFLDGDYSSAFVSMSLSSVARINVAAGNTYKLAPIITNAAFVTIDGSALGGADRLLTDETSSPTPALLTIIGGGGNDALIGSNSTDTLTGNGGNDTLTGGTNFDVLDGGAGNDVFRYLSGADSTGGLTHDEIVDIDFNHDRIDVPTAVTGIDLNYFSAPLSTGSFDSDLTTAMNAAHANLQAHHALIFTPNGGDRAGQVYLVIDLDGVAGYTASSDLVINLFGTVSGPLAVSNFF